MPGAFTIFDQCFDIVVGQAGAVAEVEGLDLEFSRLLFHRLLRRQGQPQEVVKGVTERYPFGFTVISDTLDDVVVEGYRSPDAHDAFIVAS